MALDSGDINITVSEKKPDTILLTSCNTRTTCQHTNTPQFTPIEPARALVPLALLPPPVAGMQTPNHPKPQPQPQPCPIPEPSPTPLPASQPSAPVPCVSWTNTKPINKGKGQAASATPCPLPLLTSTPFVGHGLMNQAWFNHSYLGSSLHAKQPPSPNNPFLCLGGKATKFEYNLTSTQLHVASSFLPDVLASLGQQSSPINLCLSEKAKDNKMGTPHPDQALDLFQDWDNSYGDELSELLDMIEKCSVPVMEPNELHEFLLKGCHGKMWFLVEKGLVILHIFHPDAPSERVRMALMRQPGALWTAMESDLFLKQRKLSAIMQQTHKILPLYKEVKFMVEVRGLTVDLEVPKVHAICAIDIALSEACKRGNPVTLGLTAVEVYYWFEQGWYNMIDAKLGNHLNYCIATHQSGHVSPRQVNSSALLSRVNKKRPRKANPLSLPPRDTVHPCPNTCTALSTPEPPAPHASLPKPADIDTSMPQNATPGPSTSVRPRSHAVPSSTISAKAVTNGKSNNTSVGALTEAIRETCSSTKQFHDKLLGMRQTQLEIDARSVENTYKLVSDKQAAMEEERLNRMELEQERADREAADLEDCVDLRQTKLFFEQCLQAVSHANQGVASDVVGMANDHLRLTMRQGLARFQPFVAPCCIASASGSLISSSAPAAATSSTPQLSIGIDPLAPLLEPYVVDPPLDLSKTSPRSDDFIHVNDHAWDVNTDTNT
ncbi:hypothetical protein RhiTH_010875 [Rhizoctonia solani]